MPIMQKEDELIRARNHIRFLEDRYENVHGMEKDLTELFETFQLTFSDLFTNLPSDSGSTFFSLQYSRQASM